MRILCDMLGVLRVLNKVRPPRSEFRILDFTVLRLELEVGVNSDELGVDPP